MILLLMAGLLWTLQRCTKVAVVRGEIYSVEVNTSKKKSIIKRYDLERCSWQTVLFSHEGCRVRSCVVALRLAIICMFVMESWGGSTF